MPKDIPDIEKLKGKVLSSIVDGFDAFLLSELIKTAKQDILYILSDGISMAQTRDILSYITPKTKVLSLPAWDTVPYDRVSPNPAIVAERIETLSEISLDPTPKQPRIILTSVSATLQKLPSAKTFLNSVREVVVGNSLNFNDFTRYTTINGYRKVEQVMEPGEYATRGDIIDIFPVGSIDPLRIDLFGDEVEKIRTFDAITQRTTGELKNHQFKVMGEITLDENSIKTFRSNYREAFGAASNTDEIYEAISSGQQYMGMESFLPLFYNDPLPSIFNYLPMATVIIGRNVVEAAKSKTESILDYFMARTEALKDKSIEDIYRPIKPNTMYLDDTEFCKIIEQKQSIKLTSLTLPEDENTLDLNTTPIPEFYHQKNQHQLYEDLQGFIELTSPPRGTVPLAGEVSFAQACLGSKTGEGYKLSGAAYPIIACYSEGSRERLHNLMTEHGITNLTIADTYQDSLTKSKDKTTLIILNINHGFRAPNFTFISEQDILGEKQKRKKPRKTSSKDFIADVSSLTIGELVVHIEHGVGKFLGLETITAGGVPHDCLKILYANNAKLYVPVENIDVISRYGLEDDNIQLDTLGGGAWAAKKVRVKNRIREIAAELIKIAAERELKSADTFIPPKGSFDEFCTQFPYTETDDQLNAITDVIEDLGKGTPMDRLICGDVGFGKTEVALRAAFVVAMSGAQVAIIVPTTLLARQHYHNFKKRFEGFPVRIKMLSRLVTAKESKETKQSLADGGVEIVIGTHALLAKDMKFCNLGLLIIDEEQHFGVAHKEKLKNLKSNVHVLTLTATPIPRTLQLSLTGVKQLSVIATPPVDRLAARTFVMPFDSVMIKESIHREKFRGGQVFFVCPRVSDIFGIEKQLRDLVPDINIAVAHGQMPPTKLEDVMNDFAEGGKDLLLSTTIIESGIDMPTVNTMIVHRADMFGLAQLYQLRGRIGRSKIRGYCYFTVPNRKQLKPIAERRLNILKALDTLGAGFSLASHDMDIRGSGNILGEEQSGHIKEVGISLYQHMLEEEVMRLKSSGLNVADIPEFIPQISTGIPIMIPETYVQDLGVRLGLYKRIADLKPDLDASSSGIADMREELIDRFGPVPEEVENLLKTVEIKHLCLTANIEKIDAGAKGILIAFRNNTFKSPDKLIELITKSFGVIQIRPDQKLFIAKQLDEYKLRIDTIKQYVTKLVDML